MPDIWVKKPLDASRPQSSESHAEDQDMPAEASDIIKQRQAILAAFTGFCVDPSFHFSRVNICEWDYSVT